ncbi:hypothetical protein SVIOM74S_01662 [Streptomyces violarus]
MADQSWYALAAAASSFAAVPFGSDGSRRKSWSSFHSPVPLVPPKAPGPGRTCRSRPSPRRDEGLAVAPATSPTSRRSKPSRSVYSAYGAPAPPHVVDLRLVPGERVDRVAGAGVGLGVVRVGQLRVFEEPGRDVDAEAVDAPVQPEAEDPVELCGDLRVAPVPVGLLGREHVQVPLAGPSVRLGHPAPGGAAEHGVPVVGRPAPSGPRRRRSGSGAGRAAGWGGERLAEPGVLAGAVVRDDVEHHLDAQPPRGAHQQVELVEVAEERVDVAVVGHVVAVVVLRRGIEGAQPDPVDAGFFR